MSIQSNGHEHEFEPQHGLPERLPHGEQLLWQGSPHFPTLALRVFHLRKLALYFAVLMALSVSNDIADGQPWGAAVQALLGWPLMLAATALALLAVLAWFTASTTVYTLTNRRVVMRVGIVLTLTFNLPLKCIAAADLARFANGCGDLALKLAGSDRIAWLHLWPHVKPWQLKRPQPTLRAVPGAQALASQLQAAWQAANGMPLAAHAATPAQLVDGAPAAAVAPATAAVTPTSEPERSTTAQPRWQPSPT